jgi:ribosomal protein S18 acetylase RimI-like enzyme
MIRVANGEDVHQIAETHVASWRTTYIGQVPQSYLDELSVPKREAAWTEVLAMPDHRVLVAEIDKKIVGFSSFGPSRDLDASPGIGELYTIYLIEAHKGQGLGKELWDQTRDLMQQLGYTEATLWVLSTNKQARDFYQKVGFVLDGKEKKDTIGGQEVNELRYRLTEFLGRLL